MSSQAKKLFDIHIAECREELALFDHLERSAGFRADFNLRFIWIATVSALDHYISQLILEQATLAFSNGQQLQGKLLSDVMSFSKALEFRNSDPVSSVLIFREILNGAIRFKSFQSPEKISDGLSYIWGEPHKWQFISAIMNEPIDAVKRSLSAIVDRRNLIAHNGDYDEARGRKLDVLRSDADLVITFVARVVNIIDDNAVL